MPAVIKIAASISKTVHQQAAQLAGELNISQSQLISIAIETFFKDYHGPALAETVRQACEASSNLALPVLDKLPLEINQGDIFWVPLDEPRGAEQEYTHPHVVIQEDVINHSRIQTVVVCALTSNLKRAKAPGNVLLDPDEAGLSRQSVVVVSQVSTVEKSQLGDYIGSLSPQRVNQILAGMQFLQSMTPPHRLNVLKD